MFIKLLLKLVIVSSIFSSTSWSMDDSDLKEGMTYGTKQKLQTINLEDSPQKIRKSNFSFEETKIEDQKIAASFTSYFLSPFKNAISATNDVIKFSLKHPKLTGVLFLSVVSQLTIVAAVCNCVCETPLRTVGLASSLTECFTVCKGNMRACDPIISGKPIYF